MEDRKLYTKEELQELENWFKTVSVPQTLQLDKAMNIPDLPDTLTRLFDQADICYENPKMQGCIILLERIKAKLEEMQQS